jgi:acetate kinase
MKPASPRVLTINGGSSSIKFAQFEAGDSLRRILEGGIERIGLPEATVRVKGGRQAEADPKTLVHFSDVAGVDEAVEETKEMVSFLKKPDRYTKLAAETPGFVGADIANLSTSSDHER